MVDPNPARGMPLQLQRYWLAGKGAAKIRWGLPHDFNRCVRQLRKYFPKNPEGLCNILHQKALGAPPGKGHPGEASLVSSLRTANIVGHAVQNAAALTAAMEMMERQPTLGKHLWAGPLAPIGRPTEEPRQTRIFDPGALRHRMLPLPYSWRERSAQGHDGAVVVGRILGISYGPDHVGLEYAWGWGDFFDEEIIPDAGRARYVMDQGVIGSSLDPGGRVIASIDPHNGASHMSEFTIGGATMVPIPAFSRMRMYACDEDGFWDDDKDMYMDLVEDEAECGCGDKAIVASSAEFATNDSGWRGLPLAMREARFDNDDAMKRIAAWASVSASGADTDKLKRAFMFYNPQLPPTTTTSYRLPFGDVINGRLTLVYHAIYAAAALLSGAHGGIPEIPEEDQKRIRNTISEIYAHMAREFNDNSIRAPWDRSGQEGVQLSMEYATDAQMPYGDVAYADPGYQGDKKKRYPIDTVEHIRAAWSYINQADNAGKYSPEHLKLIRGRIKAAAKKHGIQISEEASAGTEYSLTDDGYPIAPPRDWFTAPLLDGPTPLTVTADGRVFGHLALWNQCHRDVQNRECVLAPKSMQEYAPFHLGNVMTAEGDAVQVGKIVMDTRHADIRLGYTAAAIHYDDTGDEVAVVRASEDQYGVVLAGAVVPEANARKVAKLRRSPLSGDWRRERGSLELTAALAVNAPAFPVYSIENDEQMSLIAAGSIWPDHESVNDRFVPPPSGIIAAASRAVDQVISANERTERLKDLLEDDEIYAQRRRAARLQSVFAATDTAVPAPIPAPSPAQPGVPAVLAPAATGANEPAGGESATDAAGMDPVAWQIAAEADARYSIVSEGQE